MKSKFIERDPKGLGYTIVTMFFAEIWDSPHPVPKPKFISFDDVVWC